MNTPLQNEIAKRNRADNSWFYAVDRVQRFASVRPPTMDEVTVYAPEATDWACSS
jgi:hypothetical protein